MKKLLALILVTALLIVTLSAVATADTMHSFTALISGYTLDGITLQQFIDAGERNILVISAMSLIDYFLETNDPVWFEFCDQGSVLHCYEDRAESFYVNPQGELLHFVYYPDKAEATYSISTDTYVSNLIDYTNKLSTEGVIRTNTLQTVELVALIDDIFNYFLQ